VHNLVTLQATYFPFTPLPSPLSLLLARKGHGGMGLGAVKEGEQGETCLLTQVHLEGWLLNQRVCVEMVESGVTKC